ncbi:AAA family ATPase [Actinoplanes teichomyceticus]|uniref:Putative kinase n=1 Tax=Actinoplanes teichomyceticus TaxID=1867 RepID=A0A561VM57_ACTTI|nr:AAA family ATPase [Actinoplanes teichomyceticus]TWG12695.1 putative kinase [Actinoplanes teichomyceticus]GIF13428.1 ATP-binding protein [Actinoplanes teichomyceticus]
MATLADLAVLDPAATGATVHIAPAAGRDLRGRPVGELGFPAGSLLVVAGVPGAGKTTLLKRLLPQPGVRVLDSEQERARLSRYLGALPYRYWRPLVHASHYLRLLRALRGRESIVVHECGTRAWARKLITAAAGRAGRRTHLLLLDVDPRVALAGQEARKRKVRPSVFAAHCRNWQRLLRDVADPGHPIHRDAATITIIDRAAAAGLTAIRFAGLRLVATAGPAEAQAGEGNDRIGFAA